MALSSNEIPISKLAWMQGKKRVTCWSTVNGEAKPMATGGRDGAGWRAKVGRGRGKGAVGGWRLGGPSAGQRAPVSADRSSRAGAGAARSSPFWRRSTPPFFFLYQEKKITQNYNQEKFSNFQAWMDPLQQPVQVTLDRWTISSKTNRLEAECEGPHFWFGPTERGCCDPEATSFGYWFSPVFALSQVSYRRCHFQTHSNGSRTDVSFDSQLHYECTYASVSQQWAS